METIAPLYAIAAYAIAAYAIVNSTENLRFDKEGPLQFLLSQTSTRVSITVWEQKMFSIS